MMIKKKINKLNLLNIKVNKKKYFEYFISQEIEAGLVLHGWEVRSLRLGKIDISKAYVSFKEKKAYLVGAVITPLDMTFKNMIDYKKTRFRKLLLKKKELDSLFGTVKIKGHTIVVLSIYWKNAWCKMKIGVGRGKKIYDKRLNIKNREWEIQKSRIFKNLKS